MRLVEAFYCITMVLCSGCTRDSNFDDYEKRKLDEDLSKITEVTGLYTGELISKKSKQSLGKLVIEIQEDTRVLDLDTAVPVLRGKVIFLGDTKVRLVFKDSYYDSTLKKFKSTLSISSLSGEGRETKELDLIGYPEGETLRGSIEFFGYGEHAGTFVLEKQKSGSAEDLLKPFDDAESNSPSTETFNRSFSGEASFYNKMKSSEDKAEIRNVALSVSNFVNNPEFKFFELFSPKKKVSVVLDLDTDIQYVYDGEWDEESQRLTGRGFYSKPFYFEISIQCIASKDIKGAFECKAYSSRQKFKDGLMMEATVLEIL